MFEKIKSNLNAFIFTNKVNKWKTKFNLGSAKMFYIGKNQKEDLV